MASSSSWLGVFSPRISRMLVGWKAIIPSSWSKLCAPRRGRGRRGTAEQIARAHTFLFFFFVKGSFGNSRHRPQELLCWWWWWWWRRMMTGKSVKDVDRYQAVLNSLLALEENKYCADCESKGRWFPSGSCFPGFCARGARPALESTLFDRLLRWKKNAALHSSSLGQLHCTMVQRRGATSLHGWSMACSYIMPSYLK